MKRLFGLTIAASIFSYAPPWRRSPRGVLKLGVLNDMSSLYTDAFLECYGR